MKTEQKLASPLPRDGEFPATDQPLRDDVNRLGALVGEILVDQLGVEFLTEVERVRHAAIARREQGGAVDTLATLLADVDTTRAAYLVRAFATYFQAVNVAERVHRIRRRRDYERHGAAPQPGGLREVLQSLRDANGVTREDMQAMLARLHVEPVFTAHPTEAVRRSLLDKEQVLVRGLIADIDRQRTPAERRTDQERMRVALTASWQTAESASERPSVSDEIDHVGYFLADVLYATLPVYYEVFEDALAEAGFAAEVPAALHFGTWVGGDMDGNPNVGAVTIAATLAAQRAQLLSAYRREIAALANLLSQSTSRVDVAAEVTARVAGYRELMPKTALKLKPRYADMPYRLLLSLISARLAATEVERPSGYADVSEFRSDIGLIGASLCAHRGEHAGWPAVRQLLRRIDTFGFHLATLDLRQDSAAHDAALAELLADATWSQRGVVERTATLRALVDGSASPSMPDATAAQPALDVFRTVSAARSRYGAAAFGPYIVSMSRSVADALAVLALARIGGCIDEHAQVPLDIAPLFETIADLHAAPAIVQALFDDPLYRSHLQSRGGRQIVMLGYSDSAKDGGLFASRWALQQAQVALTELARSTSIRIVFFHGRGGSISRGGGKTERAVIAAPRGSVDGYLRLTEQGEVIHRKYGIRAIALRNLEQATGAVLRASLRPRPAEPREARWREMAQGMSALAQTRYRQLVYENSEFVDYFRLATPIDVIERLRIGSRPPRRAGAGGIERLRAIPWVFAWSQNRCSMTAWYGVGSGLADGIARHGLDVMRSMTRDWAFFATLVDDIEMVLAKSDMAIFSRYSELAGPLHERLYAEIATEFERTHEAVLQLKGSSELLSGDRRLRESIRLRNPYVDPISVLQVDLLKRWREAERPDDALFQALVTTINGIAAGVQNTG